MTLSRLAALALFAIVPTHAADFHISPTGHDTNAGTATAPFLTLAAARDAARPLVGKETVTIHLADGTYYLPETFTLTPQDSGTAENPVTYQAEHEGAATLSGGLKLVLDWKPFRDDMFQATTPAGIAIDQLFIAGVRQPMARYPNFDPTQPTIPFQGASADAISAARAARWADPTGGFIHAMHPSSWGDFSYLITGKNLNGEPTYVGGWQNNRKGLMHKQFRMVENIFEELDAPGEWFHNAKSNTLYYYPTPGTNLATCSVEIVRLPHLIELNGSDKAPVRYINFRGFTLRHTARTFMENKEPLLRSDWTIYRGGAVKLTGTESVQILDCTFDQVGGNAIFFNNYNRHGLVKGCHIHDAGASGVCFVGDPAAVRNPLFEYGQKHDLAKIDRTPGPQTDNYPADCAVEDCLINGIGRVERQPAAVEISMSSGISIRDCSIYDCSRAGINIGDGCWGGHLIERCDVFDTVLETSDHGSFNSWGRDRYWDSNHREISEPAVKNDPTLPLLDVVKPIVLRDSRWRCDHGWDVDLDDGSSNYQIYNNVFLSGGLKFREGYHRKAWNNVFINCGFHPHVWFDQSDSALTSNILMAAHRPIGQPAGWGEKVDRNLFTNSSDLARFQGDGVDLHSIAGNPKHLDPAHGDFRVAENSPAIEIGFRNFPMDQFGVKKTALRALAKTPIIPTIAAPAVGQTASPSFPVFWLGCLLHGITGEEFSAFGVDRDAGGVQLVTLPKNSEAATAGLFQNDLIQAINGTRVTGTSNLFQALFHAGDTPLKLTLIRAQKPVTLTLPAVTRFITEPSGNAGKLTRIPLPKSPVGTVTALPETHNDPVAVLTDGEVSATYGPVFSNGTNDGAYKLDLGSAKTVTSINTWSFNQAGRRGAQLFTAYGSAATTDPGWNTADEKSFLPIGSVDTRLLPSSEFAATSLRPAAVQSLGTFRWIVWRVSPVTDLLENTAYQEISVTTTR